MRRVLDPTKEANREKRELKENRVKKLYESSEHHSAITTIEPFLNGPDEEPLVSHANSLLEDAASISRKSAAFDNNIKWQESSPRSPQQMHLEDRKRKFARFDLKHQIWLERHRPDATSADSAPGSTRSLEAPDAIEEILYEKRQARARFRADYFEGNHRLQHPWSAQQAPAPFYYRLHEFDPNVQRWRAFSSDSELKGTVRERELTLFSLNVNRAVLGTKSLDFLSRALDTLREQAGESISSTIIVLHGVDRSSLQVVKQHGWVQQNFNIPYNKRPRDIASQVCTSTGFANIKVGNRTSNPFTTMLLSKDLLVLEQRAFRIPFMSRPGCDILAVDIKASPSAAQASAEQTNVIRICTTDIKHATNSALATKDPDLVRRVLRGNPSRGYNFVAGPLLSHVTATGRPPSRPYTELVTQQVAKALERARTHDSYGVWDDLYDRVGGPRVYPEHAHIVQHPGMLDLVSIDRMNFASSSSEIKVEEETNIGSNSPIDISIKKLLDGANRAWCARKELGVKMKVRHCDASEEGGGEFGMGMKRHAIGY